MTTAQPCGDTSTATPERVLPNYIYKVESKGTRILYVTRHLNPKDQRQKLLHA